MRYLTGIILVFTWLGMASALTPPRDNSPGFFAGEWTGSGDHGAFCYLTLINDGSGLVLIDGGAGDWLGARLTWRNQQQTLVVEKITPLRTSFQRRIMPLDAFTLRSGFNQSLSLNWNQLYGACQMQKVETLARHLDRARSAIDGLPPGGIK